MRFIACFLLFFNLHGRILSQPNIPAVVSKIAFGSCNNQNAEQPMWETILRNNPDMFIFLGDNIYGDTEDMAVLKQKYAKQAQNPGYKKLKAKIPVLAVWDDHDYGVNDGGKEYPKKEESKEIFLDFFEEPLNSQRRIHKGIYHSLYVGEPGKMLQIILLDNRTFRDKLCLRGVDSDCVGEYEPCMDTSKTMLGAQQWIWLENELKKPADLRLVCTSTQFLVDFNGWEAWANMPHERQRFLNLIEKTKAEKLFFISGDLHYAELSVLRENGLYPIYDLTSSGLTHGHNCAGENKNRIQGAFMSPNFGWIDIDWTDASSQSMTLQIRDVKNDVKISKRITLSDLSFKNAYK
jgi:alkaline phosphatase D